MAAQAHYTVFPTHDCTAILDGNRVYGATVCAEATSRAVLVGAWGSAQYCPEGSAEKWRYEIVDRGRGDIEINEFVPAIDRNF